MNINMEKAHRTPTPIPREDPLKNPQKHRGTIMASVKFLDSAK
jgi:hypothetical protein